MEKRAEGKAPLDAILDVNVPPNWSKDLESLTDSQRRHLVYSELLEQGAYFNREGNLVLDNEGGSCVLKTIEELRAQLSDSAVDWVLEAMAQEDKKRPPLNHIH